MTTKAYCKACDEITSHEATWTPGQVECSECGKTQKKAPKVTLKRRTVTLYHITTPILGQWERIAALPTLDAARDLGRRLDMDTRITRSMLRLKVSAPRPSAHRMGGE